MIESYDFGFMIINGRRFTSDCIVTPKGVDASWWRRKGHELAIEDIRETIEREGPEAIVIGKGKYGMMKVLPETAQYAYERNIEIVQGRTDDAVRRFNELVENKRIVGFFHLTC